MKRKSNALLQRKSSLLRAKNRLKAEGLAREVGEAIGPGPKYGQL